MEALIQYASSFLALALAVIGLVAVTRGILVKKRRAVGVGLSCLVISIAWFAFEINSEFWAVDDCLDSGGRYSYEAHQCDHE